MFSIEFSRKAEKFLERLQKNITKKLVAAIEDLKEEPYPRGAIKVKGEENVFRIRVGDYRILYEVHNDKKIILIADVDKRSRIYENL